MSESQLLVITIALLAAALMLLAYRRLRAGDAFVLRPLPGYRALRQQLGLAIEGGRRPHLTLGRGPLHTVSGPSSVAALKILDELGASGAKSTLSPRVTVGTGTLLPAAEDTLRRVYEEAGRDGAFPPSSVEFIADDSFPFSYAAGVSAMLDEAENGSLMAAGRFGEEIIIINEAAQRAGLEQVTATDDPLAMALATAGSGEALWGEELFAAGAYLEEAPLQVASVRAQDMLRWLLAAIIVIIALLQLLLSLV
ncbi:MAG TPA: DUF6754 domain-containing protein [Candidatus Sulfomarinibacteraceae bacterium]|nr:DUF6754 domain-containing protein [Candidatus Sulfomarinibacteraceae bacterium]